MIKFLEGRLSEDIHKYYMDEIKDGEEKEYLLVVSNYIQYYHCRAWFCKHVYCALNVLKLAALAGITICGVISKQSGIFAAVSSALCLFLEGIMALYHLREKWILYRNTNNTLMSEVRCYVVSQGKYQNSDQKFSDFVDTVENIIGDEARKWNETVQQKKREQSSHDSERKNENDLKEDD